MTAKSGGKNYTVPVYLVGRVKLNIQQKSITLEAYVSLGFSFWEKGGKDNGRKNLRLCTCQQQGTEPGQADTGFRKICKDREYPG